MTYFNQTDLGSPKGTLSQHNLTSTWSTYNILVTYLSSLQVLFASLGGLVPLYAVFTTSWGYEYLIKKGHFFSFHTHSVHRWGRFWPLLAPLAKSHKEFAGTTADQILIFVLKIAPGKTDQAGVAIRKVFLNHLSRRTEFKGLFSRHVSTCVLIWI